MNSNVDYDSGTPMNVFEKRGACFLFFFLFTTYLLTASNVPNTTYSAT